MKKQYKWPYTSADDEKQLVKQYVQGQSECFGPLYHKYKGIFYWTLKKWYPNMPHHEKEDLSLEFLGHISQKLDLYDPDKSQVNTWMTMCIRNFLTGYSRRASTRDRWREVDMEIHHNGSIIDADVAYQQADALDDISYRSVLRQIYQTLGPEDTRIFELHFLQGHSQVRTGKILGLERATMWYRIQKIRKNLKFLDPNNDI
jgi:RNA polymerase sigma factor (sigma-70 family)